MATTTRNRTKAARQASKARQLPRLRTSERGTFERCRWLWWLEFEETLKPLTPVPPLRFGSLVHRALAVYYKQGRKRGPHPAKTFAMLYERECREQERFGFRVDQDDTWVEAGDLGEAMLNHYVEHFGADDGWEVVVTEQPFQQIVKHPDTGQPWFMYVGVLDLIIRLLAEKNKPLAIVDHKTAATIETKYLSLDNQPTAYWTWGLDWVYQRGLLKSNQKPRGMLFNILRKSKPDERPRNQLGQFLNKDGSVSKVQPSPYFERHPIWRDFNERERARERVLREFREIELVRSGFLAHDKAPSMFHCRGCWAFDLCELDEVGADTVEFKAATTKRWEPYADHEVYDGR